MDREVANWSQYLGGTRDDTRLTLGDTSSQAATDDTYRVFGGESGMKVAT